ETWGPAVLGRYVSLGFVMLVVETLLRPPPEERSRLRSPALQAALWIALAFYTHLFGGVLAGGAVGLVALVRRGEPGAPRVRDCVAIAGLGLLAALPCLVYSLQT